MTPVDTASCPLYKCTNLRKGVGCVRCVQGNCAAHHLAVPKHLATVVHLCTHLLKLPAQHHVLVCISSNFLGQYALLGTFDGWCSNSAGSIGCHISLGLRLRSLGAFVNGQYMRFQGPRAGHIRSARLVLLESAKSSVCMEQACCHGRGDPELVGACDEP